MALLGGKLLATSLTLGSGGSGGIFAPALFLGAMLGGLVGTGLGEMMPHDIGSVGSYALVAMGALVAATTRAPITAIIIIFEMTNNYTIILPLMIACILATLLAGQIVKPSIYQTKLLRRGVDLEKDQGANTLSRVTVSEVNLEHTHSISMNAGLAEVLDLAVEYGELHYIVTDDENRYIGLIHLNELRFSFFNEEQLGKLVVAADLVHPDVPTLVPDDTLDVALKLLGESGLDILPVVDPVDNRRVRGILSRDAVIEAYNRELLNRDLAGETAGLMMTAERTRSVELGDDQRLVEMEAPAAFVGKRLADLDLRRRYSVQVVMIRRQSEDGRREREIPAADYQFRQGDTLLLLGRSPDLERLGAG